MIIKQSKCAMNEWSHNDASNVCMTLLRLCIYVTVQGGNWVLPNAYLLAFIGTHKVWHSLMSGTLVNVAGYINLAAIQDKKVDKN